MDKEGLAAQYNATGAMFDTVICARRSNTQTLSVKEKTLGKRYTGTAFQYNIDNKGDGVLEIRFTTDRKKVINTINPFTGENFGNTIFIY